MDILLIFVYIVGAYTVFLGLSYLLVKILFPKLEEDGSATPASLRWRQLRRLTGLSMNVPQRIKRFTEKRYRKISYPISNSAN